jgi:hypothetical protein
MASWCFAQDKTEQIATVEQMQAQIEHLKANEAKLLENLNKIQGELSSVREEIAALQYRIIDEQMKSIEFVRLSIIGNPKPYSRPSFFGDIVGTLDADEVLAYDYIQDRMIDRKGWLKIRYQTGYAYIMDEYVEHNELFEYLKKKWLAAADKKRELASEAAAEEARIKREKLQVETEEAARFTREKLQAETNANLAEMKRIKQIEAEKEKIDEANKRKKEAARKSMLIKKYGERMGTLVSNRKILIGMTKEMVSESWGKPSSVNRTVTGSFVHEQWIYGETYLYFENGILTSFQDHL